MHRGKWRTGENFETAAKRRNPRISGGRPANGFPASPHTGDIVPYLLRRIGHAAFLLIGVSALAFLFTILAPGNYFDEMRLNPQIAPQTIAALRSQYEIDRPLPVRYAHWVGSLLHGDMGFSFAYN